MRDINLFEGIKKSAPQKTSRGFSFGFVLLILCAVVLGGFYGYLKYAEASLDSQIDAAAQNIAMLQAGEPGAGNTGDKQNQLIAIGAYNTALTGFQKELGAFPKLNLALLNDIAKCMPSDVTVSGINMQDGVLTLTGVAAGADSPANFAAALKTSAYFDAVVYAGSNYMAPETPGTAGKYQYSVGCHLKGGVAQ